MLILASASPRRRDLLAQIGLDCMVQPAHIDETRRPGEDPRAYVRRLSLEKAMVIACKYPSDAVLAADTTVVLDGAVLNKPRDVNEARTMLHGLADRAHFVYTGVTLIAGSTASSHVESTTVHFTSIPGVELEAYLSTGDSLDKAGAYGIQGYAARWIHHIQGDFFNVMGLPLAATMVLLRQASAFL